MHRSEELSLTAFEHPARAIAIALGLSLINYMLRALRWVLPPASAWSRLPAGFVALSYFASFAFSLSPGRVDELTRALYYVARGVPFNHVAAICVTERLMDVISDGGARRLALYLFPSYQGALLVPLALAVFATRSRAVRALASPRDRRRQRKVSSALARVTRHAAGTLQSARTLLRPATFCGRSR